MFDVTASVPAARLADETLKQLYVLQLRVPVYGEINMLMTEHSDNWLELDSADCLKGQTARKS